MGMKYIRVRWKHTNPDEPVWIFSEVESDGGESRKLECFMNGFCDFASPAESSGTTKLSTQHLPEMTELGRDAEFEPVEITKEEFEEVWKKRHYKPT
jgi:hypothetical protein